MNGKYRHPLVGELLGRPTCHGYRAIGGPFCPISPEERDQLVKILEREAQDMICTGCGSTKQQRWLDVMGMASCCDARNMVPAAQVIQELAAFKAGPPPKRHPSPRQVWIASEIEAGRGVNRLALMAEFGVSRTTAGTDIAKFMADHAEIVISTPPPAKRQKLAA